MATSFEPIESVFLVKSTEINTHENKTIHSIFWVNVHNSIKILH